MLKFQFFPRSVGISEEIKNVVLCFDVVYDEIKSPENNLDSDGVLKKLKPHFIILKPTLHGGLSGCMEWIEIAEKNNIGWWMTSALESNIGLNAIAQFAAQYPITFPHGLGTGQIYTNNFPSPLEPLKGFLHYQNKEIWDLTSLFPSEAEELYMKS